MEQRVKIDFRLNDSITAVSAAIGRINELEKAMLENGDGINRFILDLSRCEYIGPDGAAIIGRLCVIAESKRHTLRIIPPTAPRELREFWKHSGLDCFPKQRPDDFPPRDQLLSPIIPLRRFHDAKFNDADQVVKLIKAHQSLSADTEEFLRICINEMIQNVKDHSNSTTGAIMAGRYMGGIKRVRIAIVDDGLGIPQTLKERYPDTTPERALQRVIKGDYSAMSRPNNRGLGISNLCNIVTNALEGEVFIFSDTASVEIKHGKSPNVQSRPFKFNGTGVFFSLPVSN